MLTVRRTGWRRGPHEIEHHGVVVAGWDWDPFARRGALGVGGRTVTAAASGWTGRRWSFIEADGRPVAHADGVGHARWDLLAAGGAHRFQNVSWWRPQQQQHLVGGVPAGWVVRHRSRGVRADLPALDPLLALCAVVALAAVCEQEGSTA